MENAVEAQREIHLKDYLYILRRRSSIAVLFFLTVVISVTIASFVITPVYKAGTTVFIDVESPNVLTTTGTVALESNNYLTYREYYQSQLAVMTSYSLIKKVFDEFNLMSKKEYAQSREPIKKFMKTISVEPIRDTRLARLNVENEDPVMASRIANRITELFVQRNLYYISKNEYMNLLKNEYLKLDSKLSEYSKVYKEAHPEMIRLKKELTELSAKIENEKKLAVNYDFVDDSSSEGQRYALVGFKANNISIQDLAEIPVKPVRPKKTLNIMLSLIIGFFGGIGLAFFAEYLDDTIKESEDIEHLTTWPFLGNVPRIDIGKRMTELERDIFVSLHPKDPVVETYKLIRTSIVFSSTEERPVKCILVTSPGPQEGKTTTLCNLGIAIAQGQKRVLLIDADMRKPRLHNVFKRDNRDGLSSYLSGQVGFDELVQKTDIENLYLVTGGQYPPNPSELLSSHKMKEFIEKAKSAFDFVIVDTPPVAMLTDAVIVSSVVDGVVLVIESGKTTKKMVLNIARKLNEAKAHVLGILLNKIHITARSYYYYSYYYGRKDDKGERKHKHHDKEKKA